MLNKAAFGALYVALACEMLCAQDSASEPWLNDPIVADKRNICNVEGGQDLFDNPFDTYDVEAWKTKIRSNCWFPVVKEKSEYFIKVFDWGIGRSGGVFITPNGVEGIPTEVWVHGEHKNDKSVSYRRSLTLYRVVCARGVNRYAIKQFIAYDASGAVVENWERGGDKLAAAVPGSIQEAITGAVCR